MKKKNIIKKLLSVILSAATVFSLLTLPAHAIVPGEDAYTGQENGYIHVDLKTKEKNYIPKSSIPKFNGNSSYDALAPDVRARMSAANNTLAATLQQQAESSIQGVDNGTFSFVSPTQYLYSGVVLIAVFDGNQFAYKFGTGFMLNDDTFISSLHTLYPYNDNKTEILVTPDIPQIRVYFDVNIDRIIGGYDELTEELDEGSWAAIEIYLERHHTNYINVTDIIYSDAIPGTTHEGNHDDTEHDWFMGKLETPITDDVFYWDCAIPPETLNNSTYAYIVGYPIEYSLRMVETLGLIRNVWYTYNHIDTANQINCGMSGGPIYVVNNGIKCYGINIQVISEEATGQVYQRGVKMHTDLLALMADYMN